MASNLHTWLTTSTSSSTVVAVFSNRHPAGHASFHVDAAASVTEALVLLVRVCGTVYETMIVLALGH